MIDNYKTYRPKYAILVRDIKLTDEVHKRGNPQYMCRNKRNEDCCVVVRKKCKGYSLVSGWGDYMECVMQGYQTVKAVITNDGIGKFCRQYGEKFLPIEKVIVPDYMARTTPAQWKIERVEQRLGDKKQLDKPVTLNAKNEIVDGYTRYLVARELGMSYIPCRYIH